MATGPTGQVIIALVSTPPSGIVEAVLAAYSIMTKEDVE
jgi:hypothetical protein